MKLSILIDFVALAIVAVVFSPIVLSMKDSSTVLGAPPLLTASIFASIGLLFLLSVRVAIYYKDES